MDPTSLPSSVQLDTGAGGLERLRVAHPDGGTAEIYCHGAHLTAWQPARQAPVVWMSRASRFEPGAPIRGGVPICFPWFGAHASNHTAPAHGFARLRPWTLSAVTEDHATVTLAFTLRDDEHTRASAWPHAFEAEYCVSVGQSLGLALAVRNTGGATVTFEAALHTYFAVSDIRSVHVTGLEGKDYLDKVVGFARRHQAQAPVRFEGETDRVYLDTRATCALHDAGLRRRIDVRKTGSESTVVWNPWFDKARAMSDFGNDEWTGMVCVETCNVGQAAIRLGPGERHTMSATVEVAAL